MKNTIRNFPACIIILVIFLFNYIPAFSFPYNIDKKGIEMGLSDNNILCIEQDNNGFVWIGTDWGLNCFNGNEFISYKAEDDKPSTINNNGINKLLNDKKRNLLWIATKGGGLNIYDCKERRFRHYPAREGCKSETKSNSITDICFSRDGSLWIASYNEGLKRLYIDEDSMIHYNDLNIAQLKKYSIKSIIEDDAGIVYVGHWGEGFTVFNPFNNTIKYYRGIDGSKTTLSGNEILDICIDNDNRIWLATHHGLVFYDKLSEKFTVFKHDINDKESLSENDVHSLSIIDNSLWVGTWRGGVNILDLDDPEFYRSGRAKFKHILPSDLPSGLSSPYILSTFKDSFDNIWIGTFFSGLNIINNKQSFFNKMAYSSLIGDKNGLSHKMVSTVCCDSKNRLWVGYRNGAVDIYENGGKIKTIEEVYESGLPNYMTCSFEDSNGDIWFGNDRLGLLKYNEKKGCFDKILYDQTNVYYSYINTICEDRNNNLWIAANGGVMKYNPKTKECERIDRRRIKLWSDLTKNIIEDKYGNIWVGSTLNGMSIITPDGNLIKNFNSSNGLNSNNISQIIKTQDEKIVVATPQGIVIFEINERYETNLKFIDKNCGLPDNYVRSVSDGKPGELWITTNSGISRYNISNGQIDNYDYHNGIPWGTFTDAAVTGSKEGILYFGSQDGICYFNSNNDPADIASPEVKILSFKVYNENDIQSDDSEYLSFDKTIKLPYNKNRFRIDFSVIDYGLSEQVEYSYTLSGDNNIRYETKKQNHATFINLPVGKYIFEVSGKLKNQKSETIPTTIEIIITPPFWKTGIAKMLYIISVLLIIIIVIRFYKKKIILENKLYLEKENNMKEQKLNEEKLRFYTHVTHELRTPLTLIKGPVEDMIRENNFNPKIENRLSLIHKNTERLYTLVNQIMEFRKCETFNRTLNVKKENLSVHAKDITLKYKELNGNKDLIISFFAETDFMIFFDKEVLTIILDNLISNAVKYTKKGFIKVSLRSLIEDGGNFVEIEVKDTGCGIPQSELDNIFESYYQVEDCVHPYGNGIGLALVKNLVTLHLGMISVESKLNEGTTFRLRLQKNEVYNSRIEPEDFEIEIPEQNNLSPVLLIVEDNDDIREYIADTFHSDFEVVTAVDGSEGLRFALQRVPDIIITDLMMPVMDGIEMCRKIKEDIRISHIPVIMLTAKDTEQNKEEGYLTGADSYMTKPFSSALLKARVENLLQKRKKMSDYYSANLRQTIMTDSIAQMENDFVKNVIEIIETNLESGEINISYLASQVNMGYSTFTRKIKALTGLTVNEMIRKIKMQNAEKLLLSGKYNVTEVMYRVGYNSLSSFREAFKNEFGVSPSGYIKKKV